MKKYFIKILITTMVISFILPAYTSVKAEETGLNEQISLDEVGVDTLITSNSEELGSVEAVSIDGNESEESVNVNIKLDTQVEEIKADMLINADNIDNYVDIETTDENGHTTTKNYSLEIIEMNEDKLVAKVIDNETLEETIIDSSITQTTAIPIIVALIVRAGLQYAIKHYGKKAAMQALIDLGVSSITKAYGGSTKNAKNGKGKVITIPNKNQTIVIRLMEAGSGGRKEAYWRMSVGNKALNRAGNYSNNANETHITLQESSISTIINLIKRYKK
ncbi:SAR2788 family putative toxin [Sutcliffiella horikoshii]|uniref:SAR2788 family putative toxin n=1 Tax=Sutcliffiella horikoshii TaxID=79883 RepID=UPI001CBE2D5A|nr:SAR2788 family putative toxin [Sutcliffiella horikoshii]UAL45543.1 SAR2788 family putative toxin [Sutcliffiella horikoshii]